MKVRLSARAAADLAEVGDWIAVDNPARADSFMAELLERATSLSRHPRRFAEIPGMSGVRKLSWRGYLILYRIQPDTIEIARIVHGARDWAALLDGGQ